MSNLYSWLASLDPAIAFLFVLPFAIGVLGLLADAATSRRPSAGDERVDAKLPRSERPSSRLTAHQR
ncbi:MAG: hypothetical protein WCA09_05690 [Burkholderiales bacterium]